MPKVAVITGASAGVGRATALAFAKEGYSLGLLSRNRVRLQSLQKELSDEGVKSHFVCLDVCDATGMLRAAEEFERELGPIEVWVNNAMASVFAPVSEMKPEEYKRVTDVTYLGVVYGTLAALQCMKAHNKGVIVQVGSALAHRGIPLQSAYCAAKHAIQGFHDSLRSEHIHEKSPIRVTMVQLPAINTPQFDWSRSKMPYKAQPVPPIFQPELAAAAIVWASKRNKKEVLLGWPAVKAVWGDKLFSSFADRRLAKTGYDSQMTEKQEDPDRDENLYHTVNGNHFGTHGRFDARARKFSLQFWLLTHRAWVWTAVALALILVLIWVSF